jgi:bifunctional DNA-binding transcriptional regulator/antitoxin component of YhaV-PrlF toxin-antitoxin module
MATLSVTSRGQVTFNKEVLRHFGVKPGEKLALDLLPDGSGVLKLAKRTGTIEDFINFCSDEKRPYFSDAEIKKAIEEAWAGRR